MPLHARSHVPVFAWKAAAATSLGPHRYVNFQVLAALEVPFESLSGLLVTS